MESTIYFVTTTNCNLRCRHCYISAGPNQQSIDITDFKKIIGNLPKTPATLTLSGGEVFSIKNRLYEYLAYVREENENRNKKNQGKLLPIIQTNGFWAISDKKINKILAELQEFNIQKIDITSNDRFHFEQGIKKENLEKLVNIAEKKFGYAYDPEVYTVKQISMRGTYKKQLMPVGRAAEIVKKPKNLTYHQYCLNSLDNFDLTVHQNGKVYACCFGFFELPGNLLEAPLKEIIKRAKKDERLAALNKGGIRELAYFDGYRREEIKEAVNSLGKCGFCYEHYGKYFS